MKSNDEKKRALIEQQMHQLYKQEKKLLTPPRETILHKKINPLKEKVGEKIPEQLEDTLKKVFEKGFEVVFDKGVSIIEQSYNKEKSDVDFLLNNYRLAMNANKENLKQIDQSAKKNVVLNQLVTTVEGGALGFLGIGLPDVPIFIGMLLKNIYQVSMSYGFDYQDPKEKVYILYLICVAATKDEEQRKYARIVDQIGAQIDQGKTLTVSWQEVMKEAAEVLANSMLMAKFVQGFMIVGAVGGISNLTVMNQVSKWATLKYKKRYLMGM